MSEPVDVTTAGPDAGPAPLMAQLADRVGMTEGQLYTAVLGLVLVVLLSLTGLPHAHQRSDDDGLSGSSPVLQTEPTP